MCAANNLFAKCDEFNGALQSAVPHPNIGYELLAPTSEVMIANHLCLSAA
jgi:hypothetical protein